MILYYVTYTVSINRWTYTKTIRATNEISALELFCEWWERDGSRIEELSSYFISKRINFQE
jgi:hypothetical protein